MPAEVCSVDRLYSYPSDCFIYIAIIVADGGSGEPYCLCLPFFLKLLRGFSFIYHIIYPYHYLILSHYIISS